MFEIQRINDSETFDISRYPEVESEMAIISKHLHNLRADHKTEIVISFLKDHSIKTSWLVESDKVVKMMRSGFFKTSSIETLFTACKHNARFLEEFERYIRLALV